MNAIPNLLSLCRGYVRTHDVTLVEGWF